MNKWSQAHRESQPCIYRTAPSEPWSIGSRLHEESAVAADLTQFCIRQGNSQEDASRRVARPRRRVSPAGTLATGDPDGGLASADHHPANIPTRVNRSKTRCRDTYSRGINRGKTPAAAWLHPLQPVSRHRLLDSHSTGCGTWGGPVAVYAESGKSGLFQWHTRHHRRSAGYHRRRLDRERRAIEPDSEPICVPTRQIV